MNPTPIDSRARAVGFLLAFLCLFAFSPGGVAKVAVIDASVLQARLGMEHLGLLDDPTGRLQLDQIRQADVEGRFRAPPSDTPALGYHAGATWVRFAVRNDAGSSLYRWLDVNWLFQQSYTLYLINRQGGAAVFESGSRIPVNARPVPSRRILFPLLLEAGEEKVAYLRIAGRAATVVDLTLWQPATLMDVQTQRTALRYLGLGSTLLIVALGLLIWRVRMRWALLGLPVGQVLLMVAVFALDGFFVDVLPIDDRMLLNRFLLISALFGVAGYLTFSRAIFVPPRPGLSIGWALQAMAIGALLLAVALCFWPLFSFAVMYVFAGCIVLGLNAALGLRAGGLKSVAYFLAWGGFLGSVLTLNGLALGLWPGVAFNSTLPTQMAGFGSFALLYALILEMRDVRRESRETQERLRQQELTEQVRLTAAVMAQTHALREAKEELEQANKAKSAFLSAMSHELRTPLHTILGYTQLLMKRSDGDDRGRLGIVERSGRQLLGLIDEMLDYSRGQQRTYSVAIEPISLRSLIAHIGESARLLAEQRRNRIDIDIDPTLPDRVEADEQRVSQVLHNLIGNACKYTERGRIVLRVKGAQEADDPGYLAVQFSVQDSGIGISPDEVAQIFEPFHRGAEGRQQPGLGLGLAIARQLVRAMGGEIAVDSTPGQGSRFFFTLRFPRSEDTSAPPTISLLPIVGYRGPVRTVLVVDDIAENRMFLDELLSRWGFHVLTATHGAEALSLCSDEERVIDIALVDQFMPFLDGWGFLHLIRRTARGKSLPILLISAALPDRPADFPNDLQFEDVLLKPVNEEQLAAQLARHLGLEWIRNDGVTDEPPPAVQERIERPGSERLQEPRRMLALGQVISLCRWAERLATEEPRWAFFADEIVRLCHAVDLVALKRLLDDSTTPP